MNGTAYVPPLPPDEGLSECSEAPPGGAVGLRFSMSAQISLGDPAFSEIADELRGFEPEHTIAAVGGLLTVPAYHPEHLRIELLLHLACSYCDGSARPRLRDLRRWLGSGLGQTPVSRLEDPPEDVFISNVTSVGGNYRLFEGIWESSDFALQQVLECLLHPSLRLEARPILPSIHALLRISDAIAERANVVRWQTSRRHTPTERFLRSHPAVRSLIRRTTFTASDLADLRIDRTALEPFLFPGSRRSSVATETLGNSSVDRFPAIQFGRRVVCACPTAISPAIRRFVLEWADETAQLDHLQALLRSRHQYRLFKDLRPRLQIQGVDWERAAPEFDSAGLESPESDSMVIPIDSDKLAIVVLVHDDLDVRRTIGLFEPTVPGLDFPSALGRAVEEIASGCGQGLALVIWAGIGGACATPLPRLPKGWHSAAVDMADLDTLATAEGASFLRVWKLLTRLEQLTEQGIEVGPDFGLLNLYAFWKDQNFQFVPRDVPFPSDRSVIMIEPGFVRSIRESTRRAADRHAAPWEGSNDWREVERHHRTAFFASLNERPIYVEAAALNRGELCGVVERPGLSCWVRAARPEIGSPGLELLFRVWQALLEWIDRIADTLVTKIPSPQLPIHLRLSIAEPEAWDAFQTMAQELEPAEPEAHLEVDLRLIELRLPAGFLGLLGQVANDAERALLEQAVWGALALALGSDRSELRRMSAELVTDCMGGVDSRSVHLFSARDPIDSLPPPPPPFPRLIQDEDISRWRVGLSPEDGASREGRLIEGLEDSRDFLNKVVEKIWTELRERLEVTNASQLIYRTTLNNEAIYVDRERWKLTSRAVLALHGAEDVGQIAAIRESERAQASLAGRILIEMGSATCSAAGGGSISWSDFDDLLAGVATLLRVAFHSDSIHGGFSAPRVEVAPNGELFMDQSMWGTVGTPYAHTSFGRRYRDSASEYDRLFVVKEVEKAPEHSFSEEFSVAFRGEYGIRPDDVVEGIAELMDLAVEKQTTVLSVSESSLRSRLAANRGFQEETINGFLGSLSLPRRNRWDGAPNGFHDRDWYPWKFRRRLAVSVRPLVPVEADEDLRFVVGMQQLRASISYLFSGIQEAVFPVEFFSSGEMKRYRGARADELGHEFVEQVDSALRDQGWSTQLELPMARLGASSELGDLDVVAWRNDDPRLLLIECKRLQPVRTIGEIVEVLTQFRGEEGDSLGRHIRRVEWVRANLGRVKSELGLPSLDWEVHHRLVTNGEVPMQFYEGLAIPPHQVVPVFELALHLEHADA